MRNSTLQLTIRGIDPATKAALRKSATSQGVSVNQFVVTTLQNKLGTASSSERIKRMREFWDKNPIPDEEIAAIEDAIRWHKQASLDKQKRDQENGIFGT